MRTFAFGDIHGNIIALQSLLELIKPTSEDTLIFLGDYIDRGQSSKQVIDLLIDLGKYYHVITLLGNHEIMLLDCAANKSGSMMMWITCGAKETLLSYGSNSYTNWLESVPESHWSFYHNLLPFYETDSHIFVHAGVSAHLSLAQQSEKTLFWDLINQSNFCFLPHYSGKKVIVGHTITNDGNVLDYGHLIMVDTYKFFKNSYLSAYCLENNQVYQVNDFAQTRITSPVLINTNHLFK